VTGYACPSCSSDQSSTYGNGANSSSTTACTSA